MQNGTQDSLPTHNVGTEGEFPAEIASWLMRKYLNQVHSLQKLACWMRNVLTWLDWQILMMRLLSFILPKMEECEMKICTVPVHGFQRQSSIVAGQNLEGCIAFPRKPPKRMHRRCSRHYVSVLWRGLPSWRIMCLPMKLFVSVAFHKKIVCAMSRWENPAFK